MKREVLFTHDDLDGAGCRIVYELAHSDLEKGIDYDVINCSNNSVSTDVLSYVERAESEGIEPVIMFGDICASVEVMNALKTKGYSVEVYDHHRTNFPVCQIFPNAVIMPENDLGVEQSGTSLMYQMYAEKAMISSDSSFKSAFNKELLPMLVEKIRSYDTYEWKRTGDMEAKKLQTLFYLLGMERFCNHYIRRVNFEHEAKEKYPDIKAVLIPNYAIDFVDAKIEMEQKAIDGFTVDDFYQFDLKGYKVLFSTSTRGASISELAAQFLPKHPEYDIMINCYLGRGGKFEMRTVRDDIDLGAEIATPIGGGGHPKAAGAPFPQELNDKIIDAIIDVLKQ